MCFLGKMIKIKKLKQKNKKGSHIGIILSIVMFIGFLIFLYAIMGPAIKPQKDKQALLDSLGINLLEQVSANLTTVSIFLGSYTPAANCIEITHPTDVAGDNFITKNADGALVNSNDLGASFHLEWSVGEDFYKVYYSTEQFESTGFTPGTCENPGEVIKSIKTNEKIFETKIIALISIYGSDYEDVKERLRVPERNDFSFNFTYNNGTNIGTVKQIPLVSIYTEEVPVQYVDREANLEPGAITIKVW